MSETNQQKAREIARGLNFASDYPHDYKSAYDGAMLMAKYKDEQYKSATANEQSDESQKIILEGKQAKPLVLAATGCPYFLIVQQEKKNGTKNYSHVSAGFDLGVVFDWLKNYADKNAEFRAVLSDFIIELTQKV